MNFKALTAEFIGAFALIFIGVGAIAGNIMNNGATGLAGIALAHGLTIAVMATAVGAISGAPMNPARHLGPALLGGGLDNIWLYWAGPVIGRILTAQVYSQILEKP